MKQTKIMWCCVSNLSKDYIFETLAETQIQSRRLYYENIIASKQNPKCVEVKITIEENKTTNENY
jgi:hypothetical protein